MSLASKYDFNLTEKKNPKTNYWKQVATNTTTNFASTLLLPPPNITGNLHLGHAFELAIQDFL
ncbi:5954_t:CDS:1, partial [Racocetra persica]